MYFHNNVFFLYFIVLFVDLFWLASAPQVVSTVYHLSLRLSLCLFA